MIQPRRPEHGPGYAYAAACSNIAGAFGALWAWIPYIPYIAVGFLLYFVIFYYVGQAGVTGDEMVSAETIARWQQNIRYAAYAVPIGFLVHLPWILIDMGYQRKELKRALGVLFIAWPIFDFGLPTLVILGSMKLSAYLSPEGYHYSPVFIIPGIVFGFLISLGYWTNWNRWREGR